MPAHIAEIRAAARASQCPIADLLADAELDHLVGTVMAGMANTGWRLLPPGVAHMASPTVAELLNGGRDRRLSLLASR